MSNRNLTIVRLEKEEQKILKNPIKNCLIRRKGALHFHFCIYGLDGDYEGGYYHGVLELASNYPFAPPVLKFFTPSGRFEPHKPICTTFTNYHKQTWSTAWNVQTMVLATISFFQSNQNTAGSVNTSSNQKKQFAKKSLAWNLMSEEFNIFPIEQFDNYLSIVSLKQKLKNKQAQKVKDNIQIAQNSQSNYLMWFLLVLFAAYIAFKVYQ